MNKQMLLLLLLLLLHLLHWVVVIVIVFLGIALLLLLLVLLLLLLPVSVVQLLDRQRVVAAVADAHGLHEVLSGQRQLVGGAVGAKDAAAVAAVVAPARRPKGRVARAVHAHGCGVVRDPQRGRGSTCKNLEIRITTSLLRLLSPQSSQQTTNSLFLSLS